MNKGKNKSRGFVTVATGDLTYYKQAYNLLLSFRIFDQETPFAILCDRENRYTKSFSDVIILQEAKNNYLDKLSLLVDCPYDENIFIETDCLVYHNLSHFWELLSGEYDFTSFGYNECSIPYLVEPEYAAERLLGDRNALIPTFNPGYFFVRKGDKCRKIYADVIEMIYTIYKDPFLLQDPWLFCNNHLRDDPVLWFSMAKNGCKCTKSPFIGKCVSLPSIKKITQISLSRGKLDVFWFRPLTDCNILHFSSRRAKEEGLYLHQTIVLKLLSKGWHKWIIYAFESKPVRLLMDFGKTIAVKIIKRIRNSMLHLSKRN